MDANDFKFIESRLSVRLPGVYKRFMGQFPNDPTHQLANDCDFLPSNAESFVIRQLRRFNNDAEFDYYELQPDLWNHHFMDIGGDGCGNFYCMVGNDSDSSELWMWEHDPYNGFTPQADRALIDYFGSQWELVTQTDPFSTLPAAERMISRANHPLRSILNPITMTEWRECVANN
ncbi:MAG: SMI1/KNR4 family protein, partial [Burkholderiales bacterium]